ncbi:hypothetical protein D3C81_762130 [compost metagenome]
MTDYESLAHLSRWRRTVIWLCEDKVGRNVSAVIALTVMLGPMYWLGLWWLAVIAALWIGFVLGYNTARWWASRGELPPRL